MKTSTKTKKYQICNILTKEFVKSTNSFKTAKGYYKDTSNVFVVFNANKEKLSLYNNEFSVV